MHLAQTALPPAPVLGRPDAIASDSRWLSTLASGLAGLLTPFTISVVGEMPLGEVLLGLTAAWTLLCLALNHGVPSNLFLTRTFRRLMICQGIALCAYIGSDLFRHSAPHDMARGWARMVFLFVDVVAVVYLCGRHRRNLLFFIGGQLCGEVLHAMAAGPLFGDWWKFGVGVPLTFAVVLLGAQAGRIGVLIGAGSMAAVHFNQDFRSAGGLCLLLAAGAGLQLFSPRSRRWVLPIAAGAALILLAGFIFRDQSRAEAHRSSRSDIDRGSMLQAAAEAFRQSPFIGHGSWFSNSQVYDNFLLIRAEAAKEAGIGGFVGPNEELTGVSLHSQLLVALAEGGLFGGAFFLAYGVELLRALRDHVLAMDWRRDTAVRVLLLLFASWNLLMSPFSGAHRVYIAMAVAAILLGRAEHLEEAGR